MRGMNGQITSDPESKMLPRMTVQEAEKALDRAGMIAVRARKIHATKQVGDFITQIGVLSYGRGILAFTVEQARETLEKLQKVMSKRNCPDALKVEYAKVIETLADKIIKSADILVKSALIDSSRGSDGIPPARSFPPGQTIVPIQAGSVHLNVGTDKQLPPCESTKSSPS